jgi:hypothetical protein
MPLPPPTIRFHGSQVTFYFPDPEATIFYTLDGSNPLPSRANIASQDSPLDIGTEPRTVKAMAASSTGILSAIATEAYVYRPRPVVVTPADGQFDRDIVVEMFAEGELDEIHFTVDGSVPNMNSPVYEGPITLQRAGVHVVTAALFARGKIEGEAVRRTYSIVKERLPAPTVRPPPGTYTVPLQLVLVPPAGATVHYTLDGTEPTAASLSYSQPILILQEGPLIVNCRSFSNSTQEHSSEKNPSATTAAAQGKLRPSLIASFEYQMKSSEEVLFPSPEEEGGAIWEGDNRPHTVLPLENVEFHSHIERSATVAAEKTAKMVSEGRKDRDELKRQSEELQDRLRVAKADRQRLLTKLDELQQKLSTASCQKSMLLGEVARTVSELTEAANTKLEQLHEEQLLLQQRQFTMRVQTEEAEKSLRTATQRLQQVREARAAKRASLERLFLNQKKQLTCYSDKVVEEAQEASSVVAEQRHELWLLRETQRTVAETLTTPLAGVPLLPGSNITTLDEPGDFLSQPNVVDIPVVETTVTILSGRMRHITGVHGNGLRLLREKHKVQAMIIPNSDGNGLSLRVYGHARGVHNLLVEVAQLVQQ